MRAPPAIILVHKWNGDRAIRGTACVGKHKIAAGIDRLAELIAEMRRMGQRLRMLDLAAHADDTGLAALFQPKEAAEAFGASHWQLLKDVELPLALPSIMTGVNQTILMCLSMVVIISLIGDGGLGKEILEALQYAAKGPGLLGGFAILFLAMVMDRIVQGAFRRKGQ